MYKNNINVMYKFFNSILYAIFYFKISVFFFNLLEKNIDCIKKKN